MVLTFVPGGRYENADGAFTVLEVLDGNLRVLTDAGKLGRYTVANQQIHARPSRRPSPFIQKLLDPTIESVASLFRRKLGHGGWEIYPQPHLNGLRPALVVLNPLVGIALFHVGDVDILALSSDRIAKDLVGTLVRYKQEVLDLYCPRLGLKVRETSGALAVVTTGLILPRVATREAKAILAPWLEAAHLLGAAERYARVCGKDVLQEGKVFELLPSAEFHQSRHMDPQFANDLRTWLFEPDSETMSRLPLELNAQQRQLARRRTSGGYRRIKGPAGSGKSLVLAARAAELALQGKKILVVSFNITLLNYLRSLAARYPAPGIGMTNRVTWVHFHDWCKRVCLGAGFEDEYNGLWRGRDDDEDAGPVLETSLPELVDRALTSAATLVPSYDAILVDEGQDFNLGWWNLLRRVLRPEGEMLLIADETQDLYGRARAWTDQAMLRAGFSGPWVRLRASYRLPPPLVPHLQRFAENYLAEEAVNVPEAVQLGLDLEPVRLRWLQVDPRNMIEACVNAVKTSPIFADPHQVTYSDLTLLVDSHGFGAACVQALEESGIRVAHVFSKDSRDQRRRKLGFHLSDARVKACTVHSFKGWETRNLVVGISHAETLKERALVYVALSRLKRSEQGSFLTVVSTAPELESYGRTWPEFEAVADHTGTRPSGPAPEAKTEEFAF